jgi:hypothetical protein
MGAARRDVPARADPNRGQAAREGDHQLAAQVEQFMQDMATVDTERRQMQRALLKQVKQRLQERGHGKEDDTQK